MITSESLGQELEQSKFALQEKFDMDKLKYEKAKKKFDDLNGLLAEIEKEIYSTIFSIKTIICVLYSPLILTYLNNIA